MYSATRGPFILFRHQYSTEYMYRKIEKKILIIELNLDQIYVMYVMYVLYPIYLLSTVRGSCTTHTYVPCFNY